MEPGTKVKILIDTFMCNRGAIGVVHDKNFTDGLVSVALLDVYDEHSVGPILDFDISYLEVIE